MRCYQYLHPLGLLRGVSFFAPLLFLYPPSSDLSAPLHLSWRLFRSLLLSFSSDPTGMRINRQELGYSHFKNVQRFFVQEAPETSPTGQLPRSVEVLVEEDLCDRVKCGDRVRIWGVYRPRMGTTNGTSSGLVRPFLIANNMQVNKPIRPSCPPFLCRVGDSSFPETVCHERD